MTIADNFYSNVTSLSSDPVYIYDSIELQLRKVKTNIIKYNFLRRLKKIQLNLCKKFLFWYLMNSIYSPIWPTNSLNL